MGYSTNQNYRIYNPSREPVIIGAALVLGAGLGYILKGIGSKGGGGHNKVHESTIESHL